MVILLMSLIAAQAKPAPSLTLPATAGGTIGKSITLPLAGKNIEEPVELFLDATPLKAKFKANTASFEVPKVVVGLHALRLQTKHGISNLRPFAVDALPEVASAAERTKKETPQSIAAPCVVVATTTNEASDWYKLAVKANQRLTFEVVGRRLGSPIDPVLILHDAKTGRELPGLYADDTIGLQTDARLTHTFTKDAEILIEVRDTTYRGGAEYGYRLRIGDFANSIAILPYPITIGDGPVFVRYPEVTQSERIEKGASGLFSPIRKGHIPGWGVSLRKSEIAELVEEEPNDDHKTVELLSIPQGVSAGFGKKNDIDCFAVELKKGDKIRVVAESHEFALSTEVFLKLLDPDGKEVAKSDPMKLPAAFDFDGPAAGKYVIVAEHLNFAHGPTEAYHLVVTRREPDAIVTLGNDAVTLPGKLKVANLTSLESYEGPVELKWVGDDVVTVKAIQTGKPAKVEPPKKDDKKKPEPPKAETGIEITLEAKPGAKPGVYFGRLVSTARGRTPHAVLTMEALKKEFPNLAVLPAEINGVIAVVIK